MHDQVQMENAVDSIFDKCNDDIICRSQLFNVLFSRPYTVAKVHGLTQLSALYDSQSSDEMSLKANNLAIKMAEELDIKFPYLGSYYASSGALYCDLNKLDSAIVYAEKSLQILNSVKDTKNYWKPLFCFYQIYEKLKNKERALYYLKHAYEVTNPDQRMDKGFILYHLLGELKDDKSSLEFEKYLNEYIIYKKSGTTEALSTSHLGLFDIFENNEKSIKLLEDKISKIKEQPLSYNLNDFYYLLAKNYFEKKDYTQLIKVLSEIKDEKFKNDPMVLKLYYEYYKVTNQNQQALQALEAYTISQDSSYRRSFEENLAKFEATFQTKEKEEKILKQNLELQKAKTRQRSLFGLFGLLLVSSLFGYFIYQRKLKHQAEMNAIDAQLHDQKIRDLERENKLLALNSMIEGQEAERMRIAQDLHDGLGGLLTTVKAHFNSIQREMENIKNLNVYDKTNQLIDEACVEVRRIAHNMVPNSIKISGLKGALQDLKHSLDARGFDCELEIMDRTPLNIDEQKSNMIYRIIQEITNNAVKHSQGKRLLIQLLNYQDGINITIEDDGKGFDINSVMTTKGMGLKSIDSRIKYLNGTINYDSSPNHGTTVNIEILNN